jgi:molybdenum cofactor cytidylyltransferase
MGRPKQLLPLGGRPLLQHVVDLAGAELAESVLVLGAAAAEIHAAVTLPPTVRVVLNPAAAEGQATSLRTGLAAMPPEVSAALVLLGDQPGVRPDAVRAVASGPGPIRRASYGGRPGHPVRLDREVWQDAMGLEGDAGARELLRRYPDLLVEVEVGGEPPPDVDTPEDYARLRDPSG